MSGGLSLLAGSYQGNSVVPRLVPRSSYRLHLLVSLRAGLGGESRNPKVRAQGVLLRVEMQSM